MQTEPPGPVRPRVFVSFATGDAINRQLILRLKEQALDVWDFQSISHAIPIGASIEVACLAEIDRAQLVAVLVTEQALHSKWVAREVEHVLGLPGPARPWVVPVVDKNVSASQREQPLFQSLSIFKGCQVDPRQLVSVEDVVGQICARLGVQVRPPHLEDPRLPFFQRLFEEIQQCVAQTPYGSDVYRRAARLVVEFQDAFENDRYERAQVLISYLVSMLRSEYPDAPVYYPTIVQVLTLCQLKRHDAALREIWDLRERLQSAKNPDNPYPDDNLPGTIGYVYFEQGNFVAAREEYKKALALNPVDAANFMSYLVSRIQCGEILSAEEISEALRRVRREKFLPGDELQVAVSVAFAFGVAGHREEALRRYKEIVHPRLFGGTTGEVPSALGTAEGKYERHPIADAVVQYANLLVGDERPPHRAGLVEACRVLTAWLGVSPADPMAQLALANILLDLDDRTAAIAHYERLYQIVDRDWQLGYEAMRGLWQSGAREKARTVASCFVVDKLHGLPREAQHFYITGAAYYILEDCTRANFDFERSGKPSAWRYEKYLHHQRSGEGSSWNSPR